MHSDYILNLNSSHTVLVPKKIVNVFENHLSAKDYKQENVLKDICKRKIEFLEGQGIINNKVTVNLIYSGLAVVLLAFVSELRKKNYEVVVFFEDKDNGGYYKMEVGN